MANWAADFLERNPDIAALPVVLKAKYSIHFQRPDKLIEGYFTGAPCFFLDPNDNLMKPLDTALQAASGGFYGAPGLDVLMHPDGRVIINGSDYQQYTELPGAPIGLIDGDKIIREFSGGKHVMQITEKGYSEKIILNSKPPLTGAAASKFIVQRTGTMLPKYLYYKIVCIDANRERFIFTGNLQQFRTWMNNATYPVTIDPNFIIDTSTVYVYGLNTVYNTSHTTSYDVSVETAIISGQEYSGGGTKYYYTYRSFLEFITASIPDNADVTQANIYLAAVVSDESTTDFIIEIIEQDWSASDPITSGNMETVYDACLAAANHIDWRSSNGISLNTMYASSNLTTSYIKLTAGTYYSLRSDRDKAGTAPTLDVPEYLFFGSSTHEVEAYRPILTVVYTAGPAIPIVSNYYRRLRSN